MPTILLKKSDTPGSVPGTANLTNLAGGVEVAVNTADKRVYSMTSASAVIELGTNPSSLTCADASFTLLKAASASITNLTATSLVLSNLSIASANITTLTSASATITNLLGTTLTISGNTFLATSSGNVGIGTASPVAKFETFNSAVNAAFVPNTASTWRVAQIRNDGTGTAGSAAGIAFVGRTDVQPAGIAAIQSTTGGGNTSLSFMYVGSNTTTEGMRLDNSGNLIVGGTSPVISGAGRGNITINGSSSAIMALSVGGSAKGWVYHDNTNLEINAGTTGAMIMYTASTERMRLTSSVLSTDISINVGIGTTSPEALLTVSKQSSGGEGGYIYIDNPAASVLNNKAGIKFGTSSGASFSTFPTGEITNFVTDAGNGASALTFGTFNGTSSGTRMTLDASGNLGIGTTVPGNYGQFVTNTSGTPTLAYASILSAAGVYAAGFESTLYLGAARTDIIDNGEVAGYRFKVSSGSAAGGSLAIEAATRVSGSPSPPNVFTPRVTLDASGNLLVGTTSGGNRLVVSNATDISMSSGAAGQARFEGNGYSFAIAMNADAAALYTNSAARGIIFGTDETERARITSGGVFCVNSQTNVGSEVTLFKQTAGTGSPVTRTWNNATSGNNEFVEFATEASYTTRGSITYNRGGGLVAYNVTSDYRAKDILGPVQNSGATIDALKVYEGQMKGASQSRPMLVAHEAQEHAPYTVTGEKDAVNEDGTPKYQQMDVSALVPLLLAEVQSLRKRVAELEAK